MSHRVRFIRLRRVSLVCTLATLCSSSTSFPVTDANYTCYHSLLIYCYTTTHAQCNEQHREAQQTGAAAAAEAARAAADAAAAEETRRMSAAQSAVAAATSSTSSAAAAATAHRAAQRKAIAEATATTLSQLQLAIAKAKSTAAGDAHRAAAAVGDAQWSSDKAAQIRAAVTSAQALAESEITSARQCSAHNAALSLYLLREAERRKQLHNKIEDLKGKIRVYVRVRPMSTREAERGCTEAVWSEGKQSVVVRDKKSGTDRPWDFDAVWAGTEAQGNTQVTICYYCQHTMISNTSHY
jgi:Microtubule binding